MGGRCELRRLNYIQQCESFTTSNGVMWKIKSHVNCNSKNVVYFLKCNSCEETYTGQTNNLRLRMNGHKSGARLGTNSDIFDKHVLKCRKRKQIDTEPLFLIYAFLTLKDSRLLLSYESYFHSLKYDTMN